MDDNHSLTVHLSAEVDEQLDEIAERTEQPKSDLAAAAIEDYVAREAEIVARIKRGLKDADAGRVIPHEQAMQEIDEIIASARPVESAS